MKLIRVFNDKNSIFSTVNIYRKRALTIKYVTVPVNFFHLCLFVRTLHATRPIREAFVGCRVTILSDRCRHNLQNKMAAPEASVHPVKIVFVTISPSAQRAKVVYGDVQEV